MSLFDRIASGVAGPSENGQPGLLDSVMGMINDPARGGISGLVQSFRDKGLGETVSSWIGTGDNQAIAPEQIQHVLGNEKVQQIAAKLGISPENASAGLAGLLPQVIDKLTPTGSLPEGGLLAQGLSWLGQKPAAAQQPTAPPEARSDEDPPTSEE